MKNITIKRIEVFVALYIFCIIVAELLGAKTFQLVNIGELHLKASVAIFVLPVIYSLSDVILEVYGKARARGVVYMGIGAIVLLMLFAALATTLPPTARFAPTEASYDTIFHSTIRISAASLVAFAVAELLDVAIFARLRARMHRRALWFRNNFSNFIGFFVDSLVFLSLAFYALDKPFGDNFSFIIGLLIPYWLLKCAMSVLGTPLVYAGVRWLRGPAGTTKDKLN